MSFSRRRCTLGWTRAFVEPTVIDGLVATILLNVGGCGSPVAQNSTDTSSSETGSGETDSNDELIWTFAEPGLAIISSPVVDAAGNMFVIAGTAATPLQQPPPLDGQLFEYFDVSSVVLVSVSPDGTQRWQQMLAPAQVVGKQAPSRPVVGASGDVWTCWAGELRRWGNDGELRWSAPGRCHADVGGIEPALASDGTYYDLDDVTVDDSGRVAPELHATSPDGESSWSRIIGEPRIDEGEDSDFGTVVGGLAIAADGRVVSGCDTCVMGQNSVAVFAASDGEPTALYSAWLNPPSTNGLGYSAPVLAGDVTWMAIEGSGAAAALYSVHADGNAGVRDGSFEPLLASDDAVVHWNWATSQVLWGETYLDRNGLPGNVVGPVALLGSNQLLAGYSLIWVGTGCFKDCGLFIVDEDGTVLWQHDGVAPGLPIPVVGDGYLVYVDDAYRLVKMKAPVEGLAYGPWPILGGDPQGTRSAEAK